MSQEAVVADPLVPQWGLSRVQYEALVDTGALDGEPVELLEGVLVEMAPQGGPHSDAILVMSQWLFRHLPEPWMVAVQLQLAATDRSEPEPDLSVIQRVPGQLARTAALVIEVAMSSQRKDLVHKPRVYAAAGVEQYWVIDLPRREVVVHTEPGDAGYATVRRLPWTGPLSVLGVPVDLAEVLDGV